MAKNVFDLAQESFKQAPNTPSAPSVSETATVAPQTKRNVFDLPPNESSWVKPPMPSVNEQLKTAPGLLAREGASFFHSLPREASEGYRFIANKLQQYGEDLAAIEGREVTEADRALTDKFVNYVPDLVKSLGDKFPNVFPRYEQSKEILGKKIEKNTGIELPEKARGAIERAAEGVGKAAPALLIPGSPLVKGISVATSAAGEALNLSEGQKLTANLTIPAITSLAQAIAQRRYLPSGADTAKILQAGERFGMTPQELAPILATEQQVGRHGRRAATIGATREAFEQTGHVLGDLTHQLQSKPAAATRVGQASEQTLLNKLNRIHADLTNRTHALSQPEQNLVTFIENAIQDINQNGSSPRQLIGTWRSINRIGAGKTELARLKDPIMEAIHSVSPEIARDLADTNLMYSRYIQNLGQIRPTHFNHFMDASELQNILGSVFTHQPESTAKAALRFMTVKAFEKMSSLILTNPTAQSLVRNFGRAVRDGRQASARALGIQLKDYVKKNSPQDYKEVDWKGLGLED